MNNWQSQLCNKIDPKTGIIINIEILMSLPPKYQKRNITVKLKIAI